MFLGLGLLAASASLAAPARAQSGPRAEAGGALRERVRAMLSGIEDAPSDEAIAALGEPGLEALIELAGDRDELGVVRLRAITAVGLSQSPRARAFLGALLADRELDPLALRAAARAYVAALGEEVTERALASVLALASHPDPAVREGAVLALATARDRLRGPGRVALERRLEALVAHEPDPALARALRARVGASARRP